MKSLFFLSKISALMTQSRLQWMENNEFTYTIICNWLAHGTWVFCMKTRAVWALKCVPFMPALSQERFEGISLHLIKASVTYCEKSETIHSSEVFKSQVKGSFMFDPAICWHWEAIGKESVMYKTGISSQPNHSCMHKLCRCSRGTLHLLSNG